MISILGSYEYEFPKPVELKLKLKDLLEEPVLNEYYLSNERIQEITFDDRREHHLNIKNATRKGFLEAYEGDGVDISRRMQYHRGTCQNGKTQTINTQGGEDLRVIVSSNMDEYYLSDSMIDYIASEDSKYKVNEKNLKINRSIACTKTTREGNTRADASDFVCGELPENCEIGYNYRNLKEQKSNLKIRKLTPKECFRLMGVRDEDFENVKKNQSKSSLYHLSGDSICIDVLMAIFREML